MLNTSESLEQGHTFLKNKIECPWNITELRRISEAEINAILTKKISVLIGHKWSLCTEEFVDDVLSRVLYDATTMPTMSISWTLAIKALQDSDVAQVLNSAQTCGIPIEIVRMQNEDNIIFYDGLGFERDNVVAIWKRG